jgi:hypothetical protein
MSKFDEDDLGLPESPIYSNYSNRLWKAHTRLGSVQSPNRSRENTDGPRSTHDESSPAEFESKPVAKDVAKGKAVT